MVMFGLSNGVAPLGVMQMSNLGYDSIFGPGCVCSNMAQATAGLVVALRTRDKNTRQTAASGSITAYMGITEPILYGVNLPKKYPLISAMIGGGLGGLYAGLTQTHRFADWVFCRLPAVLLYIGDNSMTCFINIIIAIAISIIATAIITFVLSLRFEKKDSDTAEEIEIIKADEEIIMAPVAGKVLNLSEADDEVFASKALGDGVIIEPSDGVAVAPFDGIIVTLFPTKHAIGLVSPNGAEVLIHIGINTVELNGQYFESFVKQGEQVKAGQKLVTFEPEKIKDAGYATQVMVVVTNTTSYQKITALHEGDIKNGEQLLKLKA